MLNVGSGGTTGALSTGAIANNGSLTFNRSDSFTVSNIISGTGSVAQNSPATGVVTVSGANTYTGATNITGGTLNITNNASLGSLAGGAVNISNGATLDLAGNTTNNNANFGVKQFFIAGPGLGNGIGAITNTGTVGQQNAFQSITLTADAAVGGPGNPAGTNNPGCFDVRGGVAQLNLAGFTLIKVGTNQFTLVAATVGPGYINVATPAPGSIRNMLSIETTTSIAAGIDPNTSQPYTVTYNDNTNLQMFNLTSTNVTRQFIFNGDVLVSNNSAQVSTLVAPILLNSGSTLRTGPSLGGGNNAFVLSGLISGAGQVIKEGTATVTISNPNTYAGGTTVSAGTLAVGNSTALGIGSLAVKSSGTLDLTGINLSVGALNGDDDGNGMPVASGGTITNSAAAPGTITVGTGNANGTYGGTIQNGAGITGLTKVGTGVQTLTGFNSYTGPTNVNAGNLTLSAGSNLSTSTVINVASGASLTTTGMTLSSGQTLTNNGSVSGDIFVNDQSTLKGSGTFTGNISLQDGGTISPGSSVGTLSIQNLNVNGGTLLMDLVSPGNNDKLVIAGTASFNSSSTITPQGVAAAGNYTLLTSTGLSGIAPILDVPNGTRSTYTLHFGDVVTNAITLNITGGAKSLTWTGTPGNGSTWDTSTAATSRNWKDSITNGVETFFNLDTVNFDDTGTTKNITVTGSVSPTAVVVNNSAGNDYTFGGTGSIDGAAGTRSPSRALARLLWQLTTRTAAEPPSTAARCGLAVAARQEALAPAPLQLAVEHSLSTATTRSPMPTTSAALAFCNRAGPARRF